MNKHDAIVGVLVADSASMGLHWLYDQEQLQKIEVTGDVLFRAPDENNYKNQKAFFAHATKRIGELSHYGEQVRVAAIAAFSKEGFSADGYRAEFMRAFGPCGKFVGYADRPTKALIAAMLSQGDDIKEPTGCDDDQHPALAVVPALFAANNDADSVSMGVSVISTHQVANDTAQLLFGCLNQLHGGDSLQSVLENAAQSAAGEMKEKLLEALAWPEYQPLEVASHFGLPCHLHQGAPVVWHLLKHASSFEQCVRDNVLCGGDSCGRNIMLAAMAGLAFGVPATLKASVNPESLAYEAQ